MQVPGTGGPLYPIHPRGGEQGKNFQISNIPLTNLPSPSSNVEEASEKKSIEIPEDSQAIAANKEKTKQVKQSISELWQFAKGHPFLTMGFFLGVVSLLAAFTFMGASFAGIEGFVLFQVHLPLGLSVGVIFLYYGIALINLARTAKTKDELHAKIKKLEENIHAQYQGLAAKTSQMGEREISFGLASYEELRKTTEAVAFTLLNEGQKDEIVAILDRLGDEISKGAEVTASTEIPEEIPSPESYPANEENIKYLEEIKQALSSLVVDSLMEIKNLPATIRKYPKSTFIVLFGLATTFVAAPLAYYWFSGVSTLMLVGGISVIVLAQFIVYGLSIAYEGYNASQISHLQDQFAKVSEAEREKSVDFRQEMEKLSQRVEREKKRRENILALLTDAWKSIALANFSQAPSIAIEDRAQEPFRGAELQSKTEIFS